MTPRAITVEKNIPVPMCDGTILRANIFKPDEPGLWPVLLTRLPYGKDGPAGTMYLDPVQTALQGFIIVVIQDTRGRFTSDGQTETFRFERDDGYDTVEWDAKLPGSNGRVGMYGASYFGNSQWMAATAQPPSLRAISPMET